VPVTRFYDRMRRGNDRKVLDVASTTTVGISSTGSPCGERVGCVSAGGEFWFCDCRGFWNIFRSRNVPCMTGWCEALVLAM